MSIRCKVHGMERKHTATRDTRQTQSPLFGSRVRRPSGSWCWAGARLWRVGLSTSVGGGNPVRIQKYISLFPLFISPSFPLRFEFLQSREILCRVTTSYLNANAQLCPCLQLLLRCHDGFVWAALGRWRELYRVVGLSGRDGGGGFARWHFRGARCGAGEQRYM